MSGASPVCPVPAEIRRVIADIYNLPFEELADDQTLFSSGRLDSFQLIELLDNIERAYAIKVAPGEVSLENLDTPCRIAGYIKRKKEGVAK